MAVELAVVLDKRHAATIRRDADRLELVYKSAYAKLQGATPLSLSMPLTQARHSHDVVFAFLANLLPDNYAVLNRWAKEFQVSAGSPFALLQHVGEECAGAAQLVRPERLDEVLAEQGSVEWITETSVGALLAALREDNTAWHTGGPAGWFSLAGAQSKIALRRDPNGRWGRTSGSEPTTHIIKPAIAGLTDHDLNEHLCLTAAHDLGFTTAITSVREFAGERALVVERYDRRFAGGRVIRIHQEDLCQALGAPPNRKYQRDQGPTPAQIGRLLRREVTPGAAADESLRTFADAIALNWLIGGTDAHAKNCAVLLAGSQVRLAPCYDIASVLPYPAIDAYKAKLAMKVGSRYVMRDILGRHWIALADGLKIDSEGYLARIGAFADKLPDALSTAAAHPDVVALGSPLPARLIDAVAEHVSHCRRQLQAR